MRINCSNSLLREVASYEVVLLVFEAGWAARCWGLPSAMVGLGGSHRRATSRDSLQDAGGGDSDKTVEEGERQGRSRDYRRKDSEGRERVVLVRVKGRRLQ